MYEIVMSTGDRAECDTVAACLVTAETLADDAAWKDNVHVTEVTARPDLDGHNRNIEQLRSVLNRHLSEVAP